MTHHKRSERSLTQWLGTRSERAGTPERFPYSLIESSIYRVPTLERFFMTLPKRSVPLSRRQGTGTRSQLLKGTFMLLAIDPGADQGWALFDPNRHLIACGLGDPRACELHVIKDISRVILEKPMIYPGGRQQARPADIITLAIRAGETGGLYRQWPGVEVEYVEPFRWKRGAIKKEVCHERMWLKLTKPEKDVIAAAIAQGVGRKGMPASKQHNMFDAISIGLYGVGR
jgi:hypothetical protein